MARGKLKCDMLKDKKECFLSPRWWMMYKERLGVVWLKLFREVHLCWIILVGSFSLLCERHKVLKGLVRRLKFFQAW